MLFIVQRAMLLNDVYSEKQALYWDINGPRILLRVLRIYLLKLKNTRLASRRLNSIPMCFKGLSEYGPIFDGFFN